MATIYRRGSKWRVQIRHHHLKTQSIMFGTLAEAKAFASRAEAIANDTLKQIRVDKILNGLKELL